MFRPFQYPTIVEWEHATRRAGPGGRRLALALALACGVWRVACSRVAQMGQLRLNLCSVVFDNELESLSASKGAPIKGEIVIKQALNFSRALVLLKLFVCG